MEATVFSVYINASALSASLYMISVHAVNHIKAQYWSIYLLKNDSVHLFTVYLKILIGSWKFMFDRKKIFEVKDGLGLAL